MKLTYKNDQIITGGAYRDEVITMNLMGNFQGGMAMLPPDHFSIADIISRINADVDIKGFEAFIYADAAILNQEVPVGLRLRTFMDENGVKQVKKFSQWKEGGSQPIRTSNDGLKVILRTNIGGTSISPAELLTLNGKTGIQLLGVKEFQEKMSTAEFYQEPKI